jgi:hypothetical protein
LPLNASFVVYIYKRTSRYGWQISVSPRKLKRLNWQTHQLEGLALFGASGFKSPLPHQQLTAICELSGWSSICQVQHGGKTNRLDTLSGL